MAKQTTAKKYSYKGKVFKSTIEAYMYKLLETNSIGFDYEKQKFDIIPPFVFYNAVYSKFLNGRGEFKERGNKKIKASIYTPDFTSPIGEELKFVIEVKGRSFPDFSRTWRLFKKFISDKGWSTVLFLPRTQRDCQKVITLIKELKLDEKGTFQ